MKNSVQLFLANSSIFLAQGGSFTSHRSNEHVLEENEQKEDTPPDASAFSDCSGPVPPKYRRRSSDPHTFKERAEFRRDHMYAKIRPLPDLPWRSLTHKTYLDDAERVYGRKENWAYQALSRSSALDDPAASQSVNVSSRQLAVLRDYISDTLSAARLEIRSAKRYKNYCEKASQVFEKRVKDAEDDPHSIFLWASEFLAQKKNSEPYNTSHGEGEVSGKGASSIFANTEQTPLQDEKEKLQRHEEEERVQARRERGRSAALWSTPATDEAPGISAFPFLRRRALENESTLDPSLVDWTMRYFPEDNERTFAEPATEKEIKTRGAATETQSTNEAPKDGALSSTEIAKGTSINPSKGSLKPLHARQRLRRRLKKHEDLRRATFDGEGVFYHVRRSGGDDVEEETGTPSSKPKPVKGSDSFTQDVVKVPWDVVHHATRKGHTHDILRAKERLFRLSRGEDPASIP